MNCMNNFDITKKKSLENFIASAVGLLPDFSKNKNEWQTTADHCLIEAARACVFADMLGFDAELKKNLASAALFHDGNKPLEIKAIQEAIKDGKPNRAASNVATRKYLEELREKGVSSRVIRFISLIGGAPEVLFEIKKILEKKIPSTEEIAALVAHYIDDYTIGGEWVEPMARVSGATFINDVDRRMERNKNNPNYKKIDIEDSLVLRGSPIFYGMSSFEAMAAVSHEIEKKLSLFIKTKSGIQVDPFSIPEMIDGKIKEELFTAA